MDIRTKVRRWGNSVGITIPKDIADKMHIHEDEEVIVEIKKTVSIKDLFGSVKFSKPIDQIMKEIDEGWD